MTPPTVWRTSMRRKALIVELRGRPTFRSPPPSRTSTAIRTVPATIRRPPRSTTHSGRSSATIARPTQADRLTFILPRFNDVLSCSGLTPRRPAFFSGEGLDRAPLHRAAKASRFAKHGEGCTQHGQRGETGAMTAGDTPRGHNPLVRYLPYNARFSNEAIMEAERINQIASTLAGLNTRSEELRRYL